MRECFPDQEPFRAWSSFEFMAEDGSINEVELLVISLDKIYLVEIKSRPGRVSGDAGTWIWADEGRTCTDDNPLLLANRKAKKRKLLLQHQNAFRNSRVPYIVDKAELRHTLRKRKVEIAEGRFLERQQRATTTFDEVKDAYLAYANNNKRPWNRDATTLRRLAGVFGGKRLTEDYISGRRTL